MTKINHFSNIITQYIYSQLVMKNNTPNKSSVVYEYSCPLEDCKHQFKYIGMTKTTFSSKLSCRLYSRAPKLLAQQIQGEKLTRAMLESHKIDAGCRKTLRFLEAICIIKEKYAMNAQMASFDFLPSLRVMRKKDEGGGNEVEWGVTC